MPLVMRMAQPRLSNLARSLGTSVQDLLVRAREREHELPQLMKPVLKL